MIALMIVNELSIGNLNAIGKSNSVIVAWATASTTLNTVVGVLKFLNELCLEKFLGFAKDNLAH
jgi:hypothetical protein